MDAEEKECLLSYRCELVQKIDVKLLLDPLVAERVICDERKQVIEARITQQDRCRELIDTLLKSDHPATFECFIYAMANPYPFLAKALIKKFFELAEKDRPRHIPLSETRNKWQTYIEEAQCTETWTIENPSDSDNECDIDTSRRAGLNSSDSQTMNEPISPVEHEDIYTSSISSGNENDSEANDAVEPPGAVDHREISTSITTSETNKQNNQSFQEKPSNEEKEAKEMEKPQKRLSITESISNAFRRVKSKSPRRSNTSAVDDSQNKTRLQRKNCQKIKSISLDRMLSVPLPDEASDQSNTQLPRSEARMDYQTMNVDLESNNHGYGFRIISGRDRPRWPGDTEYYITKLEPDSPAKKCQGIDINDTIVSINDVSIQELELKEVLQLINTGAKLKLTLKKGTENSSLSSLK